MAVTIGYIGASARDIGCGGTSDAVINLNQIDPAVAQQLFPAAGGGWDPTKLRESVTNPFFGIAAAGELGTTGTIQRGQLLTPFPEFGDIFVHQRTKGSRRQYNALPLRPDKRGGRPRCGGGREQLHRSRD